MSSDSCTAPASIQIDLPDPSQKLRGIYIKTGLVDGEQQIEGFVDGCLQICLTCAIDGKWHVSVSTCLKGEVSRAAQQLECMNQVFARAREYGMA